MHRHGPNCLDGPVTRERGWWLGSEDEYTDADLMGHCNERTDIMEQPIGETPLPDLEIRHDLVARIRREIDAGIYETPDKWDIALERLFQHLETE